MSSKTFCELNPAPSKEKALPGGLELAQSYSQGEAEDVVSKNCGEGSSEVVRDSYQLLCAEGDRIYCCFLCTQVWILTLTSSIQDTQHFVWLKAPIHMQLTAE